MCASLLDAALDDSRLRGYERTLLGALFGLTPSVPAEVLLSSVKQQFQSCHPVIAARLYAAVVQEGLFTRNPDTTRGRWRAVGVTVGVAGVVLAGAAGALLAEAMHIAWLPGIALALLGACLTWLAGAMPRRTQAGALEAARWRAFKAHLAEASRSDKPGAPPSAHYLPYAVAFGVDQSFVRHMESVGTPPPRWLNQGRWSSGPGGVVVLPGGWYGGPGMGPRPGSGGPGLPQDGPGTAGLPRLPAFPTHRAGAMCWAHC